MSNYKLISVGKNAKTVKGDGSEYLTAILYMAPADNLDGVNVSMKPCRSSRHSIVLRSLPA